MVRAGNGRSGGGRVRVVAVEGGGALRLVRREKIGAKPSARHTAGALDLDDALGWNLIPLVERAARHPDRLSDPGERDTAFLEGGYAGRGCQNIHSKP